MISTARTLMILRKLQAEQPPCRSRQVSDPDGAIFEEGRQAGLAQIIEILETEMDEILKQMEADYEKEKREESQLP